MDEPQKEINPISGELKKCAQERDEYLNGWKRAKADFINYQKDETKRLEEIAKFSQWSLIKELIIVLDSFYLAAAAIAGQAAAKDSTGTTLIQRQLEDALKKQGLEKMEVSLGQQFDPSFHETVGESESDQAAGTIAEIIERGYILNSRVIRPARVRLAKSKNL